MKSLSEILRLDKIGCAFGWITTEDAVGLAIESELRSLGNTRVVVRDGEYQQSEIPSILASDSDLFFRSFIPPLDNK